jgi:hypothetical protein
LMVNIDLLDKNFYTVSCYYWRGGRAVECGGLENRYPVKAGSWVRIPPSPPYFAKASYFA